ncbi:uncharacterized protein ACJ7VT_011443 [Polymixia lowei]
MTSRQHVSFGTGSVSLEQGGAEGSREEPRGAESQHGNEAGRQASDVETVPRSLETSDHHTSQLHAASLTTTHCAPKTFRAALPQKDLEKTVPHQNNGPSHPAHGPPLHVRLGCPPAEPSFICGSKITM